MEMRIDELEVYARRAQRKHVRLLLAIPGLIASEAAITWLAALDGVRLLRPDLIIAVGVAIVGLAIFSFQSRSDAKDARAEVARLRATLPDGRSTSGSR